MPAVNYLSGRVAVLMGGTASEREISLQSGMAVLNSLQASGIDAVGIDTAGDLLADLEKTHPVFAFIAVHGAGGEDEGDPRGGASLLRALWRPKAGQARACL